MTCGPWNVASSNGSPTLLVPLERLAEEFDELVVAGVLHEHARRRRADLPCVAHDAAVRPFGGLLEVCVREDEERALPACLERDVLEIRGRGFHDAFCGRGAACEGYLVDAEVGR